MDPVKKLKLFASQMDIEAAEDAGNTLNTIIPRPQNSKNSAHAPCGLPLSLNQQAKQDALGITQAVMPGGRRINLLKTMMTSACERNCYYCPFRTGRNYRRATFRPEEMANTFMDMHRAGLVDGLFLSSGIIRGGVTSQDKIIATAEILRKQLQFRGYIHLKIMPGADQDQVQQTMAVANRVSVNLEAPNTHRLGLLAPKKIFLEELLRPLKWIEQIRREKSARQNWNGRWASSTTQFVVGAVGESDLELLYTTENLFKHLKLSRVYYMAFNPIIDTPLEDQPAEDPWRQHRLYQASYLLRDYGFGLEELPFNEDGKLPLADDPKLAWAQVNLREMPVELNKAGREMLMKVPGIGYKGANALMAARRQGRIRELKDLKAVGLNPMRPAPFVLLDGKRPTYQLPLL